MEKSAAPIESVCVVLDSLVLARQKHPGQPNSLDALCRRYQINNAHRDVHGALIDAHLLGQVYLAMTGGQDPLFTKHEEISPIKSSVENEVAVIPKKKPYPATDDCAARRRKKKKRTANLWQN